MSSVRRTAAIAILTIAAGLSGVSAAQASPAPAAAQTVAAPASYPDNCVYQETYPGTEPASAFALCTTGTGAYQVIVNCRSLRTGDTDFFYGKWVYKGTKSIRYCPPAHILRYVGINLRSY
ncbi:hypothetical protein OG474_01970 [Kribbella sp. NBC_01505]|uniref:hypothetical protein n=1 Tax=Kribbella sp. NBC_01505 TaxID=2903580 RepID=UPI00386C1DAF